MVTVIIQGSTGSRPRCSRAGLPSCTAQRCPRWWPASPSPPWHGPTSEAPSRDVATDLVYCTEVLDGRVVFAVEAMGTRVAAVQFTPGPPPVFLADHVEGGERPILVYRVADLGAALAGESEARAGSAADLGDPARAVLLVSNAGRPPDRVVPADSTRGGRPLQWTAGFLSAPDCLDAPCVPAVGVCASAPGRPQARASP